MSTLCGIVHFDGRPVEEGQVRAMVEAAADRSPDGRGTWVLGNLGLGFGALHSVPVSSRSQQPLGDTATGLRIVFAGRVDNRGELRSLLESTGPAGFDDSDAALVLRSYLHWQEDLLSRIIGDFSLAIWDPKRQRLFCARDLIGARPFYYHQSQSSFYFATEIRQLLAVPEIPRRANEGMLGEYLMSRMANKRETQFEGVFRLPPATWLAVDQNGRLEHRQYWDPAAVPQVRHKREAEYAEHLRELLWEAVRARLTSDNPVGIQLSGGVDSSSVVAVAADLTRGRNVSCSDFEALSLVFPGWECDESDFISAVEGSSGLGAHRVVPEPESRGRYRLQVGRYFDYPDYPNGTMSDSLERVAHDKGIRVLLTGLGGDEWFQRPDLYLADLLRKGRWIAAAKWVRSLPQGSMIPFGSSPWFVDGISPLVPEGVRDLLRKARTADAGTAWINPDFARRNDLRERLRQRLDWRPFGDLARAGGLWAATQGFQVHAIEMEERSAASFHLELRYPFHDRRVVEFGLGLPPDQRWRHGLHKHVLRQTMQGLLPESIRQRSSKAEFSRVFVEALLVLGRDAFAELEIAEAGWVDGPTVLGMYDRVEQRYRSESSSRGPELWPLWSVFGAELLYREVFNRDASDD
jgi:asparagine synthase (glutamine-hydrolysing)